MKKLLALALLLFASAAAPVHLPIAVLTDIVIDAGAASTTSRGFRTMVCTEENTCYTFFIDGDNDLKYSKAAGDIRVWASPVTIYAGTVQSLDVWFDQWTPGDAGTLIHVWYGAQDLDDVHYITLNTSGDSLGTQRTVFTGATANSGGGRFVSGAKMRSGLLWCAFSIDAGAETGTYSSTDGITWSVRTNLYEAFPDTILAMPGNEADPDDLWATYIDVSTGEGSLKVYDNDTNTVTDSADLGPTGTTVIIPHSVDGELQWPFSVSVRHSNGHGFLAKNRLYDDPNGDVHAYDVEGAGSGQLDLLAFIADNVDDVYYNHVYINQAAGVLIVTYIGKDDGSETMGSSVNIYRKLSTDWGVSWGPEVKVSVNPGNYRQLWGPITGPRYIVAWRDATSDAILTNATNSMTVFQ